MSIPISQFIPLPGPAFPVLLLRAGRGQKNGEGGIVGIPPGFACPGGVALSVAT